MKNHPHYQEAREELRAKKTSCHLEIHRSSSSQRSKQENSRQELTR